MQCFGMGRILVRLMGRLLVRQIRTHPSGRTYCLHILIERKQIHHTSPKPFYVTRNHKYLENLKSCISVARLCVQYTGQTVSYVEAQKYEINNDTIRRASQTVQEYDYQVLNRTEQRSLSSGKKEEKSKLLVFSDKSEVLFERR